MWKLSSDKKRGWLLMGNEMREYKCKYLTVVVPARSCLFCGNCTDVIWDYTNGPYMFLCDIGKDTREGAAGNCRLFTEEVRG